MSTPLGVLFITSTVLVRSGVIVPSSTDSIFPNGLCVHTKVEYDRAYHSQATDPDTYSTKCPQPQSSARKSKTRRAAGTDPYRPSHTPVFQSRSPEKSQPPPRTFGKPDEASFLQNGCYTLGVYPLDGMFEGFQCPSLERPSRHRSRSCRFLLLSFRQRNQSGNRKSESWT